MASSDAPAPPKVLVIDDEYGTRESLRFIMERDYAVHTVGSVEEGLGLLNGESFDAIVLDLRLPGLDGIEGLRRIRSRDPYVAVIILTAYASLDTAVQALRFGANDYRTKPFDVADLLGVIRRHVGVARGARRRETALASDLQRVNDNLAARIVADEHLAHLGRLAAALFHDLNGPLTTVSLSLDLLQAVARKAEREPAAVEPAIARFSADTRATLALMTEMIRTHQRFGRQPRQERVRLPVDELLNTALKVVKPLHANKSCQISRWTEWGGMVVAGERLPLFRVFYNLLANALEALPPTAGRIEIACAATDDQVIVTIADNGCGIAPANLARLFEQYFTTKPHGTGLDLCIARDIVREHGGRLEVVSTLNVGTTVTVRLPRAPDAAPGPAAAAGPAAAPGPGGAGV